MIFASVRVSAWLLQTVATRPDTLVTRQLVERGWFDQVTHVAGGLLILLLLLLVLMGLPAAWYIRTWLREITEALHGIREDLKPVLTRTATVMDHVEHISASVQKDVARVSETVQRLDAQVRTLADTAGNRLHDFDTLVGAVREEAEDLFLTTASAARGVRAGIRALRRHRERRREREALRAAETDLNDDADEPSEADAVARPRKPRLRKRRHAP